MGANIILTGPVGAGKSTLAALLSQRLALPRCDLDQIRWQYFAEIGFDEEVQRRIWQREGINGVVRYWQPFEVHAAERALAEHDNYVIDFGGGYTIVDDPALVARIRQALATQRSVFLLLPAPAIDESVRILRERTSTMLPPDFDLDAHVAKHSATRAFAHTIIYTGDTSPEAACDEMVRALAEAADVAAQAG